MVCLMLIFIIFCNNNLSNINITYNIQFKDNISIQQQNVHNNNNSLDNKSISIEDEYEQMSIDNIINGDVGCLFVLKNLTSLILIRGYFFFQGDKFPGLITLINHYLESINIDIESRCILGKYLEFVKKKAKGNFKFLYN